MTAETKKPNEPSAEVQARRKAALEQVATMGGPKYDAATIAQYAASDGKFWESYPWEKTLDLGFLENRFKLPAGMLGSLLKVESTGDPAALNAGSKAAGLFQITPDTAAYLKVDPTNPFEAADAAARYLNELRELYKGKPNQNELALAAYNWGRGNLDGRETEADPFSPGKNFAKIPPETKNFITKVMAGMGTPEAIAALEAAKEEKAKEKKKEEEGNGFNWKNMLAMLAGGGIGAFLGNMIGGGGFMGTLLAVGFGIMGTFMLGDKISGWIGGTDRSGDTARKPESKERGHAKHHDVAPVAEVSLAPEHISLATAGKRQDIVDITTVGGKLKLEGVSLGEDTKNYSGLMEVAKINTLNAECARQNATAGLIKVENSSELVLGCAAPLARSAGLQSVGQSRS